METLKKLWQKIKDGSIKEIIHEWKWILGYSRRYKKAIAFYVFLGIFGSIFSLIAAVASKQLIDIVTGHRSEQMLLIACVMISMALFSLLFNAYIGRISLKITIDIQNDIQADIFEKIEDASWLALSKYHSGDILNRFGSDVGTVANNAITWLPQLTVSAFNFIATFAVIFYYDHIMAFISLASAPILLLSSNYLMTRMRHYSKRVRQLNSEVMAFEQETFTNMNTIKSFGITSHYTRELKNWQQKFKDYSLEYNLFSIKTNIALSLVGMMTQYAAFGWGVYRLWTGHITYGEMTLFLSQGAKLSSAFNSLVNFLPTALNSSVAAGRVMELVNLPREQHHPEGIALLNKHKDEGYTIEMDNVSFGYEENQLVLKESHFIAQPNEIVALVGPSGEGKTTMLRMILGLIEPEKGKAIIRDASGYAISLNADTRAFFAYVPQGNTIFSGTIAENLRKVNEEATDEEIIEALKVACAWDFVSKMPEGIHGKLGEHGRGISEGQAQRIAIARALLRDAPIMLMDEATSALDVETERRVLKNIMNMKNNKTCIVATHRPSVLNLCQRVYRIMDGQLTVLDEATSSKMVQDF